MKEDLLLKALDFAAEAHRDQVRKYTGEPYVFHPIEVAQIVHAALEDINTTIAALLHDTVEDTDVTEADVREAFGEDVADLVMKVTKVSDDASNPNRPNRAFRKNADRIHFANGCSRSQSIKLADVISNSSDVVANDPGFAKIYLIEQEELVNSLTDGHPDLFDAAVAVVEAAKADLVNA